jgi:hypothetical protein
MDQLAALAKTDNAEAPANSSAASDSSAEVKEVVVTGIRQSMQSSLEIRRASPEGCRSDRHIRHRQATCSQRCGFVAARRRHSALSLCRGGLARGHSRSANVGRISGNPIANGTYVIQRTVRLEKTVKAA